MLKKINDLKACDDYSSFRQYQQKVICGLEKAIKEGREFSQNSSIMVNRMWENRFGVA